MMGVGWYLAVVLAYVTFHSRKSILHSGFGGSVLRRNHKSKVLHRMVAQGTFIHLCLGPNTGSDL